MAKFTPFHRLLTWLPPRRLAAWLHIPLHEAKVLIAAAPPRQRRGRAVLKYRFQREVSLAENCRYLIQQLLRNQTLRQA